MSSVGDRESRFILMRRGPSTGDKAKVSNIYEFIPEIFLGIEYNTTRVRTGRKHTQSLTLTSNGRSRQYTT
jgi:hypothetical protein